MTMESQDPSSPPGDVNVNATNHAIATLHKDPDTARFESFPKLPLEIRLKIWRDICYIPRNVGLWCRRIGEKNEAQWYRDNNIYHPIRFDTNIGVPAVLHANSEARKEALKHYTLEFGDEGFGEVDGAEVTFRLEPKIYVNLHVDCICLVHWVDEEAKDYPWRRFMAEELEEAEYGMENFLEGLSEICRKRNLQKKKLDTIALPASLYNIVLGAKTYASSKSYYYPPNCLYNLLALARRNIILYHETRLTIADSPYRSVGIENEPPMGSYGIDFFPLDHETGPSSHETPSADIKQKMLDLEKMHVEWRKQNEECEGCIGTALAPLQLVKLQLYPTKKELPAHEVLLEGQTSCQG